MKSLSEEFWKGVAFTVPVAGVAAAPAAADVGWMVVLIILGAGVVGGTARLTTTAVAQLLKQSHVGSAAAPTEEISGTRNARVAVRPILDAAGRQTTTTPGSCPTRGMSMITVLSLFAGLAVVAFIRWAMTTPDMEAIIGGPTSRWRDARGRECEYPTQVALDANGMLAGVGVPPATATRVVDLINRQGTPPIPVGVTEAYLRYCYRSARRDLGISKFRWTPLNLRVLASVEES